MIRFSSLSESLDDVVIKDNDEKDSSIRSTFDDIDETPAVNYDLISYDSADSGEVTSPNVSILLNLVSDRHYVIDTFWGDSTPSNSPYFNGSEDYLYQNIYKNYENNYFYARAVDAYYRLLNMEEGAAELWEAIVGLTLSDADKANFKNGVAAKNYEAVLSKSVSTNYTSSIGLSTNSESAGLLSLRADYDALKAVDDILKDAKEYNSLLDDAISEQERYFVLEALPEFSKGKST